MTDLSTTDVRGRTITAFFDSREAAQKATDDLVTAGVPRQHIRLTEGGTSASTTETPKATNDKGFWDELKDLFIPDEDRSVYSEGLRRGGYLLAVRVEEATYNKAMDILDTDGAIDMDEREAGWKSEGWTGYQSGSTPGLAGSDAASLARAETTGLAGLGTSAVESSGRTTAGSILGGTTTGSYAETGSVSRANTTGTVDTLQSGRDEVIPIYEESAQVAKRDVNHGRVRLRSYVVETPFSQQVNLRNEQVQVERRPVDRVIGAGDAVFQDRVIEAEEHTEEAFITKETRVKEEISLRKTVEDKAQTVSDTLRRTEVEVDDNRSGHGLVSGAAAVGSTGLASGTSTATGTANVSAIREHMDVIASDGTKIGTVDHLDGPDKIKLAKTTSPDGQHHYVPLSWVDHVDTHVHLNKTSTAARAGW